MYKLGVLIRAVPSILRELVALAWHAYRNGDRATAAVAIVWISTSVAIAGFTGMAVYTGLSGGQVHVQGPVIVAAVPVSMWLARELISLLLTCIGRILAARGAEAADVRY